MTTINHEPDSYCLPLAPSTSQKSDKSCLRLLRSTYHGSHPWCVVLIITSIRTCSNSSDSSKYSNKFEHVRTLRVRLKQVRSRLCTSLKTTLDKTPFNSHYPKINRIILMAINLKICPKFKLQKIWICFFLSLHKLFRIRCIHKALWNWWGSNN